MNSGNRVIVHDDVASPHPAYGDGTACPPGGVLKQDQNLAMKAAVLNKIRIMKALGFAASIGRLVGKGLSGKCVANLALAVNPVEQGPAFDGVENQSRTTVKSGKGRWIYTGGISAGLCQVAHFGFQFLSDLLRCRHLFKVIRMSGSLFKPINKRFVAHLELVAIP